MRLRFYTLVLGLRPWILAILLLILVAFPVIARAGGAGSSGGGYSSRSGGGDGIDLMIVVYIIEFMVRVLGPVPTVLIIAAIIIIGIIVRKRMHHQKTNSWQVLKRTEQAAPLRRISGYDAFIKRNPDFDQVKFNQKVHYAFNQIQQAWSLMDLKMIRRFISDGMYQRFHAQFSMMKKLEQRNLLSDIKIYDVRIIQAHQEGYYDILTVMINASMYDRFVCKLSSSLNMESHERFTEYWTFIRRNGSAEKSYKDIYTSNNCPNCGADLPEDLGERGNCHYCNALVNSGAFDWVLSSITQSNDWAEARALENSSNLVSALSKISKQDPNFSAHLMEDKAANAFLQILCARSNQKPESMRRFISQELYDTYLQSNNSELIAYNRLWLNQVQVIGAWEDSGYSRLSLSINYSSQRVNIASPRKLQFIDPVIRTEKQVLIFQKKLNGSVAKGSLYQHQCPACGATIADTLDTNCPYCQSVFTAASHEWIVDRVLSMSVYLELVAKQQRMKVNIKLSAFDQLLDVRDYAFNNFMVMVAADGIFAAEERTMAQDLAKDLGYKIDDMESLFTMAASGRLSIRMPENTAKRQKIIQMMEDAAMSDGSISKEEQAILTYLKNQYTSNDMGTS